MKVNVCTFRCAKSRPRGVDKRQGRGSSCKSSSGRGGHQGSPLLYVHVHSYVHPCAHEDEHAPPRQRALHLNLLCCANTRRGPPACHAHPASGLIAILLQPGDRRRPPPGEPSAPAPDARRDAMRGPASPPAAKAPLHPALRLSSTALAAAAGDETQGPPAPAGGGARERKGRNGSARQGLLHQAQTRRQQVCVAEHMPRVCGCVRACSVPASRCARVVGVVVVAAHQRHGHIALEWVDPAWDASVPRDPIRLSLLLSHPAASGHGLVSECRKCGTDARVQEPLALERRKGAGEPSTDREHRRLCPTARILARDPTARQQQAKAREGASRAAGWERRGSREPPKYAGSIAYTLIHRAKRGLWQP